jgi:hypothetical protein
MAQYCLGLILDRKGENECLDHFRNASNRGNEFAQGYLWFLEKYCTIAIHFHKPDVLESDISNLKLIANQGLGLALYMLTMIYDIDKLPVFDKRESFKYCKILADQGSGWAQYSVLKFFL